MAYQDTHHSHTYEIAYRFFGGVKSVLATLYSGLISVSEANRRMRIVDRLQHKSDAELAALGMKREDIVRRVFIDMMDV